MSALLSLVLAASIPVSGQQVKVLGWSADGEFVAWTFRQTLESAKHSYFRKDKEVPMAEVMAMSPAERKKLRHETAELEAGGDTQVDEEADFATAWNVRAGTAEQFCLGARNLTVQATGALAKKSAKLADKAAFEAWKTAHGLTHAAAPAGVKLTVNAMGEEGSSWTVENEGLVTYTLERRGHRSTFQFSDGPAAMFIAHRSAEAHWDPTGRRALLVTTTDAAQTMRGVVPAEASFEVMLVPPRVEVVAPARLAAAQKQAAEAAEKAGLAVVALGPAAKDRTATVIYAAPGEEEAAKKLASALPGATVDTLTWKAQGELVVAVGAPK